MMWVHSPSTCSCGVGLESDSAKVYGATTFSTSQLIFFETL